MSFISHIGTAVPDYKSQQNDIALFMMDLLKTNEKERRQLKAVYQNSGISSRYSVLPDFGASTAPRLFLREQVHSPSLEKRMALYQQEALPLALKAVRNCHIQNLDAVTHLISVSCTGFSAPGLEIHLANELNLPAHIQRYAVNFMGCYAAFHALKMADALCHQNPDARVLIVCTELCTIHFQPVNSEDNILANALFADGAAALLLTAKKPAHPCLSLKHFASALQSSGEKEMAWTLSSTGFLMTLSSYVPKLVQEAMPLLLSRVLEQKQYAIQHWAIHPGGRKILEAVEKSLLLSQQDLQSSYHVLKEYGNMSSPSILFVLEHLLEANSPADQDFIFAAGFGPGLSIESALLQYHA